MAVRLGNVTFDCVDPVAMSTFWAALLGLEVDDGASEFFASVGASDPSVSPAWLFIAVPEGKTAKNRMHIDLESTDVAGDRPRVVELGGTHHADNEEWGHAWSVFSDVEGNEFCVSGPHA